MVDNAHRGMHRKRSKTPHIFICLIYPASFVHSALFRTVLSVSKQSLCLVAQTWCNSMGEPTRTKLRFLNLSISSLLPLASPNLLACETPSVILVSSFCSHSLGSAVVMTCTYYRFHFDLTFSYYTRCLALTLLPGTVMYCFQYSHEIAWVCHH